MNVTVPEEISYAQSLVWPALSVLSFVILYLEDGRESNKRVKGQD